MGAEIKSFSFNDLDTRVKEHVAKFMQEAISETFGAFRMLHEIHTMLDQVNPKIMFIKHTDGKKEMQVDESDGRILAYFKKTFEDELRNNPLLEEQILQKMAIRNDGSTRLKVL